MSLNLVHKGRQSFLLYAIGNSPQSRKTVADSGGNLRFIHGIDVNMSHSVGDEIDDLLSKDNPGKPHIANLMIGHGYANDIQDAIKNYINKKEFQNEHVRPEDAIKGILKSGGIPVLAHPTYGDGDDLILGEEMEKRLQHLMSFGLEGVEAFYSGFSPKIESECLAFADQFDLYITAGSDYHGGNKMIEIGWTNLEDMAEAPPGLLRFLRDVEIIS